MLEGVPVERATFVEVTKAAVVAALASPRDISAPLVCYPVTLKPYLILTADMGAGIASVRMQDRRQPSELALRCLP